MATNSQHGYLEMVQSSAVDIYSSDSLQKLIKIIYVYPILAPWYYVTNSIPYYFFNRLITETYTITKCILSGFNEAFNIVPLSFALITTTMIYYIKCFSGFAEPNNEKDISKIEEIYSRMKKFLIRFSLLPSAKSGFPTFIILKRIPKIWKNMPFPMFLFEDTIKNVKIIFYGKMIEVIIPAGHPLSELGEDKPIMRSNVPVNKKDQDVSIATEKIEITNEEFSKSAENVRIENVSGSSETTTEADGNNYPSTLTKSKTAEKRTQKL